MEPLGRRRQEGGGGGGGAEAASTEEGVGEATREFDGRGGKGGEGEEGGSTFSQKRRKETTTSITEREVKSAAAEEEGSGEVTASTAVNNNNNGSFEAEAEVERGGGRGGGEGDRRRPTLEGKRKEEEEENKRTSDKDQGRRRPSCNNAINNNNSSTIVPPLSEVDAVSEGYKSIVRVINRASSSFREGKKWRCAADEEDLNGSRRLTASQSGYQLGFSSRSSLTSSSRPGSGKRRNKRRKEPRGQRKRGGDGGFMAAGAMERAATMDVGGGECGAADLGVENSGRLGRGRARRLVRQKATNEENSGGATSNTLSPPSMSGASSIEVVDETASLLTASSTAVAAAAAAANGSNKENNNRLRVQPRTGMPARQWTVDTCTGLKTPMQEVMQSSTSATPGTAYLLRPVSRTSIVSGNSGNATAAAADGGGGGGADRRDRSRSPMPRSPARTGGERIRLGDLASRSAASSFNRSMDASVCSSADPAGSNRALTAAERKDRRIYERALLPHLQAGHQRRTRLQKQRTSDSAPFAGQAALGGNGTMMTPQGGGSAVQLPRQPSTASSGQSYAASAQGAGVGVGGVGGGVGAGVGLSTSFSHQGITLVRGASCSLVDIPTYLGPSVAAGGGVELAPMGATVGGGVVPSPAAAAAGAIAVAASRQASERRKKQGSISSGSGRRPPPGGPGAPRPRQQIDLTKKKKHSTASVSGAEKGGSSGGGRAERGEGRGSSKGSGTRKTQWTVLCVSITLLTLAVTLVGGMLSVGSHYQEMVIARRWEELNSLRNNKSSFGRASGGDSELSGGGLGLEPFVIVPLDDDDSADGDAVDEEDLGGKNNSTSPSAVSDSESGNGGGGGSGEKNRQLLLPIIFPELLAGSEEIRRMSELAKRPRKGASN